MTDEAHLPEGYHEQTDPDLIRRSGRMIDYPSPLNFLFQKKKLAPENHIHWAFLEPQELKRRVAENMECLNPELRYESGEHRVYGRIEPEE